MTRDKVFKKKQLVVSPFSFDDKVAKVFDDMVSRSVPMYQEIHKVMCDLAQNYFNKKSLVVYDLGCSTGTTISLLDLVFKKNKQQAFFIGIDNSMPMLKVCEKKLKRSKVRNWLLTCDDLTVMDFKQCDMVVLNYTLQFVKKEFRVKLLKRIYTALNPGGIIIFSEKINCEGEIIHKLATKLYYDFKRRNGYSELEISQKRESLEDVLLPMTAGENIKMLKKAGFKEQEMLFRSYNFASFLGIK